MSKQSNFGPIFKSTFLFGGSQLIGMLVGLVRNKFAAVFLGAAGLGLNGIFLSTLTLIKAITTLGINESAVKDIAKANGSGDNKKIAKIYSVFKFWVYLTGFLGILTLLLFAPFISQYAFKSEQHSFDFQILSLSIVFGALSGGIGTYLRGIQQIQALAASNAIGAISSLLFTIPFYYYFGIEGIVPSIIATAFVNFLISLYFKNKFKAEDHKFSIKELVIKGGPMVKLGLSLSVVTILASAINFILNAHIIKIGGLHDVGLFNAGTSIIEFYIGMVFTSIAADFFPRLSSMIENEIAWKKLINEQLEFAFLLLTIGLVILVTTAPFLVRIMLSEELLPSIKFIYAAIIYIPFKVMVWIPGFFLIAKGENKLFLTIEIIGSIVLLTLNILLFNNFGIVGLGYALVVYYIISSLATYFIMLSKFNLTYSKNVWLLFIFTLLSITICLILKTQVSYPFSIYSELVFSSIVILISIFLLNKRINLIEFAIKIMLRIFKK
jgi:O-antigen/teichoic acid export membrane protein